LKGKLDDKQAVREMLMKANFDSVRGSFKYNHNHFPIQNFYLQQVVKNSQNEFTMKTLGVAVKDGADPFADKCDMK
jgi:branched-chain amino acid transport system substrate-binding protein